MLTINEQLIYTTVKITAENPSEAADGTGFFWEVEFGDNIAEFIVTNKHVIEGADTLYLRCHLADPKDQQKPIDDFCNVAVSLNGDGIVRHPDPNVDLCCIPISDVLFEARKNGRPIFLKAINQSGIPENHTWDSFDAIEDVFMIGCPNGLFDHVNNYPIVRRGISATPIGRRYLGRDEFLIDVACFPGSSGSPVFIHNMRGYLDRSKGAFVNGGRVYLVGILYAGPTIKNEGIAHFGRSLKFNMEGMMHLGQVIRSSALLDLKKLVHEKLESLGNDALLS